MSTALSFPTITGVTGAPNMPDLSEAANIQTALKYLYFGSTGTATNSNGIYGALQRLYVGDPTLAGNVTITGNLTVNGSTTTINSTTVTVDDLVLELAAVASPTDTTANGGGIKILDAGTGKQFTWSSTGGNWTSTENLSLATGKTYKINNVDIASGTGAALVLGANASSTLAIGNTSGTTTINGTVNIPNTFQLAGTSVTTTGTKLNYLTSATGTTGTASTNIVFSTSPTITTPTIDTVNTSLTTTGTAALWNTGITTGTISIGGALTTGTVNIASGTAGAKAVNIGTSTGTVGLNGKVSLSSAALSGTAVAARLEYNGDALFFTPKLNNSTAGRGLVPSDQILILNSNFGPTTVTSYSGDGLVTNTYPALNKNIYLAASQAYFVDMSIVVFHNLVTPSACTASISFSLNATSGAQGQITAISVIDSGALTGGTSTMEFFSGNANALSETLKSVSSASDSGYSILKWSGVISNSIAGNFGPQITINATSGGGSTATASATIQAGSYCKVTPLGATGSEINIGGWA